MKAVFIEPGVLEIAERSLSGRFRIAHRSLPTALVSTRSCTRSNLLPHQDTLATQVKPDQERSRAFLRQYGL